MTATSAPTVSGPSTDLPIRLRHTLRDAATVTRRNLVKVVRTPRLVVFSTIQPIMFVVVFAYVFGGAITTPGVDYVSFMMPGIFVQTVAFGSLPTGIGLAEDLNVGLIDRFRSLPMARSAVLAGRTLADVVRNLFVIGLMFGVGILVGLDIRTGAIEIATAVGLALLFAFAMAWVAALVGLLVRDPESVQAASFVWIFPLTFASSAFVPTASMPGWLQPFANNQPITANVDALRALMLGGPTADLVATALAWSLGILAVFAPLAVARYRRA